MDYFRIENGPSPKLPRYCLIPPKAHAEFNVSINTDVITSECALSDKRQILRVAKRAFVDPTVEFVCVCLHVCLCVCVCVGGVFRPSCTQLRTRKLLEITMDQMNGKQFYKNPNPLL